MRRRTYKSEEYEQVISAIDLQPEPATSQNCDKRIDEA